MLRSSEKDEGRDGAARPCARILHDFVQLGTRRNPRAACSDI